MKDAQTLDEPLLNRAAHFLRKAGPKAFLYKCWLVARQRLSGPSRRKQKEAENRLYLEKLESLTVKDGHVTVPVLGFQMKLRADDLGLSKQIILHGIREEGAVRYLQPLLGSFKTILEIGANQGYYAILEALNTPPDARIYAIEPHPDNVATLRLNAEHNKCTHKFAEILQAAVSDRTGTASLHVHRLSNWHSLSPIELSAEGWQENIEVPTVTLDEFCRTRNLETVDFVRMDVEGHEAEIIKGANRILRQSPKCVLFIELHSTLLRQAGHQPEDLLRQIQELGFTSATVCGKHDHFRVPDWDHLVRNLELLTGKYGAHLFFHK